jgi:hypothetical protein
MVWTTCARGVGSVGEAATLCHNELVLRAGHPLLERFYDGPFTAPMPTGAAAPAPDLVAGIAVLPQVLATRERQVPVLRDWSYRWNESLAEWGGRFSHWVDWTDADTALAVVADTMLVVSFYSGRIPDISLSITANRTRRKEVERRPVSGKPRRTIIKLAIYWTPQVRGYRPRVR